MKSGNVATNIWIIISDIDCNEDGVENSSETRLENKIGIHIDVNDYFLNGFLVGYNREIYE